MVLWHCSRVYSPHRSSRVGGHRRRPQCLPYLRTWNRESHWTLCLRSSRPATKSWCYNALWDIFLFRRTVSLCIAFYKSIPRINVYSCVIWDIFGLFRDAVGIYTYRVIRSTSFCKWIWLFIAVWSCRTTPWWSFGRYVHTTLNKMTWENFLFEKKLGFCWKNFNLKSHWKVGGALPCSIKFSMILYDLLCFYTNDVIDLLP